MHHLREGRRGFHASTLSGIPTYFNGRKAAGTVRFFGTGALESVDIPPLTLILRVGYQRRSARGKAIKNFAIFHRFRAFFLQSIRCPAPNVGGQLKFSLHHQRMLLHRICRFLSRHTSPTALRRQGQHFV